MRVEIPLTKNQFPGECSTKMESIQLVDDDVFYRVTLKAPWKFNINGKHHSICNFCDMNGVKESIIEYVKEATMQ